MSPRKILIVDDELHIRDLLVDVITGGNLYEEPLEIFTAENGFEALAIAKLHRLDLVFVDYNMPGMTGAELTHQLRSETLVAATVAIVMISAMDDKPTRARATEAGISQFIPKPFRSGDIRRLLSDYLKKAA